MNWNKLWTEQASNADKINKTWFAQSQKKEHLNLVSNKIRKAFCWNRAKHKKKMSNVNGIKAIKHILIYSRSDEGTPKSNMRNAIQESNRILTESKPEVDKMLICSKSQKRKQSCIQGGNKIQQHFCWRPANHCYKCAKRKILQAHVWNKIRHKSYTCGSRLKVFSKSTARKSNLKIWTYNWYKKKVKIKLLE